MIIYHASAQSALMQIKGSFKRFQLAYTGVEADQGLVRRPDISAAIAPLWPRRRLSLAGVSAILGTSIISPLEGSRLRCNAGWRLKAWRGYCAQCIRAAQHRARRLATARRDSYGLSSLTFLSSMLVSPDPAQRKLLAEEQVDLGPDRALGNVWAHSRIALGTCVRSVFAVNWLMVRMG
jgi:hypothetical protein